MPSHLAACQSSTIRSLEAQSCLTVPLLAARMPCIGTQPLLDHKYASVHEVLLHLSPKVPCAILVNACGLFSNNRRIQTSWTRDWGHKNLNQQPLGYEFTWTDGPA
jgi:hypothetical protein